MTSRSDLSSTSADLAVAQSYRTDWGRLLSLLVARTRRLDLAEDALSEAFARATDRWATSGVPANPAGWLFTTANRVVVGRLRAEAIHGRKAPLLATRPDWIRPTALGDIGDLDDERLALILLCCHPALHPEARSPLALRLVIGTPTDQIARLFVVPRATMAARITRAKRKIVTAGIPLSSPVDDELRARLDDVCQTVYLAFTAGYAPSDGPDLLRTELAGEAVELAAVLLHLVPEAEQVRALYGLLLLQHARRDARVDDGRLVTLADQDRSRWHRDQIRTGLALIDGMEPTTGHVEVLRLQGSIAAEHARAAEAADTDWSMISAIYERLESLTGSPIVTLNRAVAVGEADGPDAGLAMLEGLELQLPDNHRVHAVRADLARRSGADAIARDAYAKAMAMCDNEVEHRYLAGQLALLDHQT